MSPTILSTSSVEYSPGFIITVCHPLGMVRRSEHFFLTTAERSFFASPDCPWHGIQAVRRRIDTPPHPAFGPDGMGEDRLFSIAKLW